MEKFKEELPFLLLALFPLKFIIFVPNLADAIAFIAIALICGLKYFLKSKSQPNYLELLKEDMQKVNQRHAIEMSKLRSDITELKENYGKTTVKMTNIVKNSDFEF
jgi:hypothetical protein